MRLLQLSVSALVLLALLACGTSSDDWSPREVWLSEQFPYVPRVVPTPAPQDTATSSRSPFTSVSVGGRLVCGVREDGSVDCGIVGAPEGSFTSVSAGYDHACGLREDGSIACWGDDFRFRGQATSPQGRFVSVSAGHDHTCGVREDGAVACWGDDASGQATPPGGRFMAVSAGVHHTCGLREDGSVACWGDDERGQSSAPEGAFVSVSAGLGHTCGVRADGSVACWGDARGDDPIPQGPFRSVSAGWGFACGVREDRTVACWDLDGRHYAEGETTPPQGAFRSVNLGTGSSVCGVREDDSAACWGSVPHLFPPAVSITARTSSSLTVEWDPESDYFDYYQVHVSLYPDGPYSLVTASLDEGSHVLDGLEPSTVYTVVVLACDEFGCSSSAAVAVTEAEGPVSVPSTPTGFRGEKNDNAVDHVRLTWDAVEGATHHELWKGADPDRPFEILVRISAPLDVQSFDIAPNIGGDPIFGYSYRLTSWKVRACNKAGCSAFTNTVTIE